MRPLLLAAALTAGLLLGLAPLQLPEAAPSDAPPGQFSASRAVAHVDAVAREPHPLGSPAHAAARAYIERTLEGLGIAHETQRATSVRSGVEDARFGVPADLVLAAPVENVVARLPGPSGAPRLLLAATYDSVPTSPGAGDNGASVGIVLELLRALRAAPAPAEVVAVFADAATTGRLGARAARAHPWLARPGAVVAFGAMGTLGPTLLAQATGSPAALVAAVAQAEHPLVNTAVAEIVAATGQGSDLGEYAPAGQPSAFFASLDGWQANRTWLDRPARLDRRGLQQAGATALATVRGLAASPERLAAGDAIVATSVAPGVVLRHGVGLAWALASALTLAWVVVAGWGVLRGAWTWAGVVVGTVSAVLVGAAAVAVPALAWAACTAVFPWLGVFHSGTHGAWMLYMGWALAVPAVAWTLSGRLAVPVGEPALHIGGAAVTLGLLWVLVVRAPGASDAVALPLAAALAARVALIVGRGAGWVPLVGVVVTGAALAVPVWALVPISQRFQMLSGASLMFLPLGPVALGALLVLPAVEWACAPGAWRLPVPPRRAIVGVLLFVALGEVMSGLWLSRFTSARPRPDHVSYLLDADRGQAHWISVGAALDHWTARFFPEPAAEVDFVPSPGTMPGRGFHAFSGRAPRLNLASPEVDVEEDRADGAGRLLVLRVRSPRGAPDLQVGVAAAAPITALALDGVPVRPLDAATAGRGRVRVIGWGTGSGGLVIRLALGGPGEVRLSLADDSNGLPSQAAPPERPPDTMPAPFDWADPTEVRVTRTLCGTPGCARPQAAAP